jgi:hypothetical protein
LVAQGAGAAEVAFAMEVEVVVGVGWRHA